MACHSRGEYGGVALSDAPQPTKVHCSDSVAEWRSREQLEPSPPSTSPAYWDSDDEEESNSSVVGPKPSELYGKFTWKIENFSEISKRELRSNVFEVGGYKWYILVYPQGCDVCNHLSLFLCVADYDKLLPGWSHFAQFTIAVVNKDPKKSKYSDTLHRFCKKEHDWGWKKFMELSKVLDGFTVADTLVIKAQVQVIRENPHRPFRCLDCQYRRELVRVYLTNVEGICRRFVDEKRERLGKLMEDTPRWTSFRTFWSAVEEEARHRLAREKTDVILKAVVKKFFNEKEVTSTLVMDALYSGCKALDYRTRNRKGKINGVEVDEGMNPVVWVDKDMFVLAGDVLVLLERAVAESLPPFKDDKGPQNRTKDVGSGDDFGKDSVERDERRLTELGRRTVEIFVLAHLYTTRVEVAYREAVALKRQEELIREEEAAGQAETEMRIKREAAEKEKRSKKKQAKQRRKDRKEKDREAEERKLRVEQEQRQRQDASSNRLSKGNLHKNREIDPVVSTESAEYEDDLSGLDTIDDAVGTLGLAVEDGDTERTSWEMEASYVQSSMEASFSGAVLGDDGRNNLGTTTRKQNALDDSSSTCSSDSFPSTRTTGNESVPRPPLPEPNHVIPTRERIGGDSEIYDTDGHYVESDGMLRPSVIDANGPGEPSSSTSSAGVDSDTVILSLTERVRWLEQRLLEKEEEVVLLQERLSLFQHQMEHGRSSVKGLEEEGTVPAHGVRSSDVVRSEDGRSDVSTSFNHSDGGDGSDLDKMSSNLSGGYGSIRVNGNAGLSNGNVPVGRGPYAGALGGHDNRASSYVSGPSKSDPTRSVNAPSRSRSVDFSRPPRVITPPGQGFPMPVMGTFLSADEPGLSQPLPSTTAGIGLSISRPLSAPGSVTGGRPNIPVVSPLLHSSQPLARSMSVGAGRAAGTEATANSHTNGVTVQSPPVTPSYKNATIGKTRSSPGPGVATHALPSYSSVSAGVTMSSFPSSSPLHPVSQVLTSPLTSVLLASPPMTPSPKMRAGGEQPVVLPNCTRVEGASIGTPVLSSPSLTVASTSEMPSSNPIVQDNSAGAGSIGGRPPVGITFGTVTPELLRDDQLDLGLLQLEQLQQDDDCGQSHQVKDQQSQLEGSHQGAHHNQIGHPARHQQCSEGSPTEMSEGPLISSLRQDLPGVTQSGSINSGVALSEEFPHLDIINDLLDEDQNAGVATLKSLQHPSTSGYSRSLSLGGHKLSFGQHSVDRVNGIGSDGGDRSRAAENGDERSRDGLGDNAQVNVTFQHPPLARLHSQHNGVLDGVSSHYWPIGSSSMSSGNNGSGRNGLVDSHLAFSLVQGHHHLAVPDCSGFPLGHNGYTVYGPAQP